MRTEGLGSLFEGLSPVFKFRHFLSVQFASMRLK